MTDIRFGSLRRHPRPKSAEQKRIEAEKDQRYPFKTRGLYIPPSQKKVTVPKLKFMED